METMVRDRHISPTGAWSGSRPRPPFKLPPLDPQTEAMRHCELGKIHLEMGRYPEALQQFEQALARHPHDVESWASRSEALACLNRYPQALESLEQAQELAGVDDVRLWVQKAMILILIGRSQAALNCCNHALRLDPNHAQAWLFRGVALHRLGRFRQAYRSYQRVAQPALPPSIDSLQRLCHDLTLDHQAS